MPDHCEYCGAEMDDDNESYMGACPECGEFPWDPAWDALIGVEGEECVLTEEDQKSRDEATDALIKLESHWVNLQESDCVRIIRLATEILEHPTKVDLESLVKLGKEVNQRVYGKLEGDFDKKREEKAREEEWKRKQTIEDDDIPF